MTDSPIFARLEHEAGHLRDEAEHVAGRVADGAEAIFGHARYHSASMTENVPEEPAVDITEIAADIRTDLQAAEDKAGEVWNHAKAILDQKLPQIEAIGQAVANDKLFQIGIDATIPAPLRALGAEILGKVIAAFPPQQAATPAPAPAEGDDTTTAADPAQAPAA
jgi:hypothetical protein